MGLYGQAGGLMMMRKRIAFILAAALLMIMAVTANGLAADQDAAVLTIKETESVRR
jgi:hypothetical protein